MKKLIAIGLVISMVLSIIVVGVSLAEAPPVGAGAAKRTLWLSYKFDFCDGAVDKDDAYGFVILNTDASGKLIATFALKGATANVEYDLFVFQVDASCDRWGEWEQTLTTNNQGNGNTTLHLEIVPGTVKFWATARYHNGTSYEMLRSEAVYLD